MPTESRIRSGVTPAAAALLRRELLVRRRRRVDDERLRVADVREEREELHAVDDVWRAAASPPFTPKVSTPPKPPSRYFFALRVLRGELEARVRDPVDAGCPARGARDGERVLASGAGSAAAASRAPAGTGTR